MWPFFNPTIKVVTFRLRGWCVLGVFLLPAWTSGSLECVRWNACVHRLDLGLYSHPKEFLGGVEFEPMLTPREKSPLPENFPRGGLNPRHCGQPAQTLPTSYSGPIQSFHQYLDMEMWMITFGSHDLNAVVCNSLVPVLVQRCHISVNFRHSGYRKIRPSHPEIRRTENFSGFHYMFVFVFSLYVSTLLNEVVRSHHAESSGNFIRLLWHPW